MGLILTTEKRPLIMQELAQSFSLDILFDEQAGGLTHTYRMTFTLLEGRCQYLD